VVSQRTLMGRKLIRDFKLLLAPALVISLVMAAGLSCFMMSLSALLSLSRSKDETYQKLGFAHLTVPLVRMPRSALVHLRTLPDVRQAECRITAEGQVLLKNTNNSIVARFHSLPEHDMGINRVHLQEGRMPLKSSTRETLVSDAFAFAWGIRSGDTLEILLKGRRFKLTVSGIARSPEYVYQAGSASSLPEDRLFSVWWTSKKFLEQTQNLRSACNELLLRLNTNEQELPNLKSTFERDLRKYGYTQVIPRSRQLSNYFIESEFTQLRAMAILLPAVFIAVTLFLLHITMARVLLTQRESIGTLHAFGFSKFQLQQQTFLLGVLCLLPGAALALLFGYWLSLQIVELYRQYYRFAFFEFHFDATSAWISVGLCILTGGAGGLMALRKMLKETPAALLRPPPPAHNRASTFDSLAALNRLSLVSRMSLRHLFRRPLHSFVTLAGLIVSLAFLVFAKFERTAISSLIEQEFEQNQRQSHTLYFSKQLPLHVTNAVRQTLPAGMMETELILPVILETGLVSRELTLIVPAEQPLLRAKQIEKGGLKRKDGLGISLAMADALGMNLGQMVNLTTRDIFPKTVSLFISHKNENLMGYVATVNKDEFSRIWKTARTFNSVLYFQPRHSMTDTKKILNSFPALAGVQTKAFEKNSFSKTFSESIGVMEAFMVGFSILIAMGVIYNNARIHLSERQSELALLQAMGFSHSELTRLFWTDTALLFCLALPPGLLAGYGFVHWIMRAMETEMFRLPVLIPAETYFWSTLILITGIFGTALLIQPQLRNLPYLSLLKAKE
jgi:putative ABC transport system permease protein